MNFVEAIRANSEQFSADLKSCVDKNIGLGPGVKARVLASSWMARDFENFEYFLGIPNMCGLTEVRLQPFSELTSASPRS